VSDDMTDPSMRDANHLFTVSRIVNQVRHSSKCCARESHAIAARSASIIASRFSGGQGYFRSPTRFGACRTDIPSCSLTSAIQEALGTNPACLRTRN
jgi:hypothetical protein